MKDGKHYPPNTLHQLCCGVLRRLQEYNSSLGIFKNPEFEELRKTLDAEMKRLRRAPILYAYGLCNQLCCNPSVTSLITHYISACLLYQLAPIVCMCELVKEISIFYLVLHWPAQYRLSNPQ